MRFRSFTGNRILILSLNLRLVPLLAVAALFLLFPLLVLEEAFSLVLGSVASEPLDDFCKYSATFRVYKACHNIIRRIARTRLQHLLKLYSRESSNNLQFTLVLVIKVCIRGFASTLTSDLSDKSPPALFHFN
jgi:hypothetical protein